MKAPAVSLVAHVDDATGNEMHSGTNKRKHIKLYSISFMYRSIREVIAAVITRCVHNSQCDM